MADSAEEVAKHLKKYMIIGGTLLVFTVITVLVAKFDLGDPGIGTFDLVVGLLIAAFKASLVAVIFMHLNNEKILIYKFLVFTIVFAMSLFVLTYLANVDPIVFPGVFK